MNNFLCPNREKWEAWIFKIWVAIVFLSGAVIIFAWQASAAIPSSFGITPHFPIWGSASMAIATLLLIGIFFGILNSIYINSCDLIFISKTNGNETINLLKAQQRAGALDFQKDSNSSDLSET
ncbi:hypothetical protein VRRI112168_02590 [Vreelandella rituensis]|uniref:Uncharacterized protein n=1 Tax=Vreelandella rituensis TaxID=2282306 RepID=A0A368UBD7_9GAMM|nr:hypothetical protein [Halomonas rituensis]RCV93632.1 hypothetical protein DU506_00310 [Halomonas rituensis]